MIQYHTNKTSQNPLLSILICTLPEEYRLNMFKGLVAELQRQCSYFPGQVEILSEDTKRGEMSIGEKTNVLHNAASGEYVCRIDDDDKPSWKYIPLILEGCRTGKDIITFDMDFYRDEIYEKTYIINRFLPNGNDWRSKFWAQNYNPTHMYTINEIFYHLCPVKKEIAKQVTFSDANEMEDVYYSRDITPLIKTEYRIMHVLLSVFHNSKKTPNV